MLETEGEGEQGCDSQVAAESALSGLRLVCWDLCLKGDPPAAVASQKGFVDPTPRS